MLVSSIAKWIVFVFLIYILGLIDFFKSLFIENSNIQMIKYTDIDVCIYDNFILWSGVDCILLAIIAR